MLQQRQREGRVAVAVDRERAFRRRREDAERLVDPCAVSLEQKSHVTIASRGDGGAGSRKRGPRPRWLDAGVGVRTTRRNVVRGAGAGEHAREQHATEERHIFADDTTR